MPFLNVVLALYDYEANTEDELSIKKSHVLYILEDDDPGWWRAKLKIANPNHSHVGLVPTNYVELLPPIGTVRGLYRYEATTEEELTIEEGDALALYERDDPDWFLVGNGSHVGFVPRNYVEVSARQEAHSQDHKAENKGLGDYSEDPEDEKYKEPTPPRSNTSIAGTPGDKDSIRIWTVNEIDKNKKKKGRLGIDNGIIVFGSEVDKSPVRYWLVKDVINVRHEKNHVYLDLGGASLASLDFKAVSKQEAVAIFNKIQKSRILYYVTSATSTSLVHHFMSVPTYQTARGASNASTSRTSHHEPRRDVPTTSSSTSAPAPTHALLATTRPVRVMSKPKNMRKRATRSGRSGGRALRVP
ncbi:cytoskeletal protein binding protein [Mortierella sp. NVP85]|nr:cytoskeletal protein binding protein [Mortierella sp. NVP85]